MNGVTYSAFHDELEKIALTRGDISVRVQDAGNAEAGGRASRGRMKAFQERVGRKAQASSERAASLAYSNPSAADHSYRMSRKWGEAGTAAGKSLKSTAAKALPGIGLLSKVKHLIKKF